MCEGLLPPPHQIKSCWITENQFSICIWIFTATILCCTHSKITVSERVAQSFYVMILLQNSDTFPENKWLPGLKIIEHYVRCRGYSARRRWEENHVHWTGQDVFLVNAFINYWPVTWNVKMNWKVCWRKQSWLNRTCLLDTILAASEFASQQTKLLHEWLISLCMHHLIWSDIKCISQNTLSVSNYYLMF